MFIEAHFHSGKLKPWPVLHDLMGKYKTYLKVFTFLMDFMHVHARVHSHTHTPLHLPSYTLDMWLSFCSTARRWGMSCADTCPIYRSSIRILWYIPIDIPTPSATSLIVRHCSVHMISCTHTSLSDRGRQFQKNIHIWNGKTIQMS